MKKNETKKAEAKKNVPATQTAKDGHNLEANGGRPPVKNPDLSKAKASSAPVADKAVALAKEIAEKKAAKAPRQRTTGANESPFNPDCATDTVYQAIATAKKPIDVKGIIEYFTKNPPTAYQNAEKAKMIDGRVRHILRGCGHRYVKCFTRNADGTYVTIPATERPEFPAKKVA